MIIKLITTHGCYRQLGQNKLEREEVYKALFDTHISSKTVAEITEATDKAWVLGRDRFKQQIEKQTGRRAVPLGRGDDRKSRAFLSGENQ